MTSYAGEAGPM